MIRGSMSLPSRTNRSTRSVNTTFQQRDVADVDLGEHAGEEARLPPGSPSGRMRRRRMAVVPHRILSEVGDGLIEVEGRRCLPLGPDHGFRAHRASVASIWPWRFHGGDPECPRIFRPVYTLYEDYARPDWAGRARITTLLRFL